MSVRDVVDLTCKEIVEIIGDFFDGKLAPDDQVRFEQHLHGCTWCMTYLDQMRQTRAVAGTLREEHVADETKQKLVDAFRNWKRK